MFAVSGNGATISEITPHIDAALSERLPDGMVLYRGVRLPDVEKNKLKPGNTITDRGFTSTSTNKAFSQSWGAGGDLFVIKADGLRGLDIRTVSNFAHEDEVLLARGQELTITKIETYNGQRYVFLEKA